MTGPRQGDESAQCMWCHRTDLTRDGLCGRSSSARGRVRVIDNGPDRHPEDPRFEGHCRRCCGHNHA